MAHYTNEAGDETIQVQIERGDIVRLINAEGVVTQVYHIRAITDTGLVRLWKSSTCHEDELALGKAEFLSTLNDAFEVSVTAGVE